MIFTTKNNEFAILGNSIDEIKKKWSEFVTTIGKKGLFGENGAFASLFSDKKSNNTLTPEVLTQFDEFKEKFNSSSLSAEALAEQMKNVDQKIVDYAKTCKNGEMTTEGFKTSIENMSFSAKAGKVALQALATVGNMVLFAFISKGIELFVNWVDRLIHSSEYAQKAIQAATNSAKSFSQAIKDIQKETVDMETTVNSIAKRYAELSQGVNPFTNENKSLPTDEYEEFLDLNEQLTGLFPSLTRNYDENGNAILGLSGSVDSVTESIKALVEQEKELAKAKIRENIEQYFDGTDEADGAWRALEGRKEALEQANMELETLTNTYLSLINADEEINIGRFHKNSVKSKKNEYINYIKDNFGEDIADAVEKVTSIHLGMGLNNQSADLVVDFSELKLTETQKEQIVRSYDTFHSELLAKQKTAMSEFDSQNSEFSNNAMLWLEDLSFYKDSDKYIQTAIQNLVRSIDWSNYNSKELDYNGVKRILQDSILTPFQIACDNPDTKEKLNESLAGLFTLDITDMSTADIASQVNSYIGTIATAISNENPTELKVRLGFDDSDTQILINNVKEKLKDEFDDRVVELTLDELQIAAEQIEVSEGTLLSWDKLIAKIKEVQNTLSDDNPTSTLPVSKTISDLKDLNTELDNLGNAMASLDSEGRFDLGNLDSIADYFLGLEGVSYDAEAVNNALKSLGDQNATLEEQADAVNTLADLYLTTSKILDQLNEDNAELMKFQLQRMGISNAEKIVDAALNQTLLSQAEIESVLAQYKSIVTGETLTLANVTAQELQTLFAEDAITGETANQMAVLAIKKQLVNGNTLDATADIGSLIGLCEMLGATSTALDTYNKVKNGANGMPSDVVESYRKKQRKKCRTP